MIDLHISTVDEARIAIELMLKFIEMHAPAIEEKGAPIEALDLTVRAENCLKAENILTIEQLIKLSANSLLRIPNLGRRSRDEIRDRLKVRGLYLMGEKPVIQEAA